VGDAMARATGKKQLHDGFSITLVTGKAARLNGFGMCSIFFEYTEDIDGLMMGMINMVGGNVNGAQFGMLNKGNSLDGAQFASVLNMAEGYNEGAQFAGIWNTANGNTDGAQFGGVGNTTNSRVDGAQFGGVFNGVGDNIDGAQFAGVVNAAGGDADGAQFAGVVNATGGNFDGAQFAGVVNLTGGSFDGAQVAGVVNIAGNFKGGLQVAPVNIAQHHEGIPIGLVSYVHDVGFHYDVWGTEAGFVHAGLRSGTRSFYNLIGIGIQPGADSLRWSFGAGLGGHFDITRVFGLEVGVYAQHVQTGDKWDDTPNILTTINVTGTFDLGPVWLTAGPTFNVLVTEDPAEKDIAPYNVIDDQDGNTYYVAWPGFSVGLRL
jgi:hypothetical protein